MLTLEIKMTKGYCRVFSQKSCAYFAIFVRKKSKIQSINLYVVPAPNTVYTVRHVRSTFVLECPTEDTVRLTWQLQKYVLVCKNYNSGECESILNFLLPFLVVKRYLLVFCPRQVPCIGLPYFRVVQDT